jgi:hypothetical protein
VLLVRVACSGCPEDTEVVVEDLDEVEALFCDCDHGWIILAVSEVAPG